MAVWRDPWVILLFGWGFSALLWGSGADAAVQAALAAHYDQGFNDLFRLFGWMGLGRNQVVAVVAGGALRVVYGWWRAEPWLRQGWRRWPTRVQVWFGCLPVFVVAGVGSIVLKLLVGRPRPKEWLSHGVPYGDLHPAWLSGKFQAVFMSWPSGHAASTFAIGTLLLLAYPRWKWPLLAAMVVLSAARFLALTPHYPGDVVAGAAWGSFVALLAWRMRGLEVRD